VLRYAIQFYFAVRKSIYFGGVPCVFLRSGLVPGAVLGLGPELSEPGCPGSCAGFGLFPGLVLVLVRALCCAAVRAWSLSLRFLQTYYAMHRIIYMNLKY